MLTRISYSSYLPILPFRGTGGDLSSASALMDVVLQIWASSRRDVKALICPLFTQERLAASAGLVLNSLLGSERREAGWIRACDGWSRAIASINYPWPRMWGCGRDGRTGSGRGSNQGNTQNNKSFYYQSIDFRYYLETIPPEPRSTSWCSIRCGFLARTCVAPRGSGSSVSSELMWTRARLPRSLRVRPRVNSKCPTSTLRLLRRREMPRRQCVLPAHSLIQTL